MEHKDRFNEVIAQNSNEEIKKASEVPNTTNEIHSNFFDEAQSELEAIIQLLILNKDSFDEQMFKDDLNKYLEKYKRILYSCFTNKIFEWSQNKENDSIDNAIQNLTVMVNKMNSSSLSSPDVIYIKILDHILLANHQVSILEFNDKKIKPHIDKVIVDVNKKIIKQEKQVKTMNNFVKAVKKDIEAQKDSLLSQMIAIVAIFVGISFVMFGGMSLINDLFTYVDGQPVPLVELICLGCLIGIVMIIVMYCFIMFILSVTRNRMLRAKKIFFRIVQKSCTILGLVSCTMFIIWCCQTFLK